MTSHRNHNNGLKSMETEAGRIGFVKITGHGGNPHGVAWRIQCCRCDTKFEAAWGPRTSPDMMAKNMRRKGWDVDIAQPPLCPFHARTHNPTPMGKTAPPIASAIIFELNQPMKESPMSSPAAIPQNPQLARRLFADLEEHFDAEHGRYKNGMSDDKIAQETGAAVSLVIATREQAFGALAEDPTIVKLREDVELAEMALEEFIGKARPEIIELKRRLDALVDQRKMGR